MGAVIMSDLPKGKDRAVKIAEDLAIKALTMCSYRKQAVSRYLSEYLRPLIERDFEAFTKELNEAMSKAKEQKKPHK